MSLPRYSQYKDSGIQWLAEIPGHWSIQPMSALSTCNDDVLPESTNEEKLIKYIEISDVQMGKGVVNMSQMLFKNAPSRARRIVKTGDILVSTVRTYLRAIATVNFQCDDVIASTGFAVIRSKVINSKFLGFICESEYWISNVIARSVGVSYPAINASELIKIRIPTPPNDEQVAIVDFLDQETTKIDALIAEQEKLIELLKEKRQAVISHAVTKGLDPNVKMKDSGVEWLGQVPKHWKIKKIKWLSQVKRGASPRPIDDERYFEDDGEYSWVRISDVSASNGNLNHTEQRLSDLGSSLSVKLLPGQLFISIAGTVGKPCIAQIKACIHDGFVYFPELKIDPHWLYRIFESGECYGGLGKLGTQLNLNTDTIGSINVGVPNESEMFAILAYLDFTVNQLNLLIIEATRAVNALEERRSALISAAVTGQIDVRNVAITKEAA